MWTRYSGMLIWKTANPWAGLRGQLYDWLLAQTGGLYGARAACEPLHVQLNLHTLQARARAYLYGSLVRLTIFASNLPPLPLASTYRHWSIYRLLFHLHWCMNQS